MQTRVGVVDLATQRLHAETQRKGQQEDDRGVAEGEEEPDRHWSLAFGHELSRRVVDGRNVVGVEGVAHAEGVGEEASAQANGCPLTTGDVVVGSEHEERKAEHVEEDDEAKHAPQLAPFFGCEGGANFSFSGGGRSGDDGHGGHLNRNDS